MKTNYKTKTEINYEIVILVGLTLIIIAPIVFTSAARLKIFNFTETGPIGDTIGGITAPFVGTLGAVLVYLSFREQRKANENQWNAFEIENNRVNNQSEFEFLYKFYLEELKTFEFKEKHTLKDCFRVINTPLENYPESDRYRIYDSYLKVINNYFTISHFFMSSLLNSNIENKNVLASIFIINYYRNHDEVSMPDKDSENYKYLERNFPEFLFIHRNWNNSMDKLQRLYDEQIINIYTID